MSLAAWRRKTSSTTSSTPITPPFGEHQVPPGLYTVDPTQQTAGRHEGALQSSQGRQLQMFPLQTETETGRYRGGEEHVLRNRRDCSVRYGDWGRLRTCRSCHNFWKRFLLEPQNDIERKAWVMSKYLLSSWSYIIVLSPFFLKKKKKKKKKKNWLYFHTKNSQYPDPDRHPIPSLKCLFFREWALCSYTDERKWFRWCYA